MVVAEQHARFATIPEVRMMSLSEAEPFVTPQEAADFLRCSPITVKRLARDGKIPAHSATPPHETQLLRNGDRYPLDAAHPIRPNPAKPVAPTAGETHRMLTAKLVARIAGETRRVQAAKRIAHRVSVTWVIGFR